ncbi:MAG: radical SAM protein, partial [Thermodesulfobacteriota bacterium]
MVRVLLISSASIGPLFISALLKKEGHIVRRLYQGYKEYLGEPSAPFLPPLTEEELRKFRPDVIGFSVDTSCFDRAVEMAAEIKTILPSVYIVFGGPHPTVCPDEAIGKAPVDAICVGEGEYAMLELCNEIQVQKTPITVKNLWVQHNGEIYKNPQRPYVQDLDSIPMDREGIWYTGIYTGRGCVGRCTFCNVPTIRKCGPGGKYFRKRSFESVLDEVQIVYESILKRRSLASIVYKLLGRKKWVEPLRFKDDTFLGDRKWFLEFAKRLRKRFPNLTYLCQATANEIDEEVADWLKKSGCVQVLLGLETGSAKLRNDLLRKNVTDKQISTACKLLREQGIQILGSWMYGLPGETFSDMLRTFI